MLAMRGCPASEADRALLRTFANHAALALERAQLREQAMRSELLEEVDRLRHALIGAVSHDLRTPLATMKVASSTLLHPDLPLSDADAHELHGLIDVETDRLTRLVTSLLDMTRIDAGVLEVRRGPTSVVRTWSTRRSPHSARRSGDRPVVVAMPDDLPEVDIDQLLIGQVLANLLDNANRHAPPESLITVAGEIRGDRIAVSVTDAGPGVPPAERDAVFDRFVRFDTGGRAGLGLTIAKTFVEAHGEHIWVEDVPGGGARFVFTLSRGGHRRPAVAPMAKVLVIDDDPSLLRALRLGLQAGGHDVVTAVNGEQGISQTALTSPDVVVLDLGLPDIDGQTVCRRIRQWSEVPIIILSASGSRGPQGRRPRRRSGRLRDQALRHGRAGSPDPDRHCATGRRSPIDPAPPTITVGSLDLDLVHHEAQPGGGTVDLTAKEFDVLSFLAAARREDLYPPDDPRRGVGHGLRRGRRNICTPTCTGCDRSCTTTRALLIRTMPGVGYSLNPDPVTAS